MSSDILRWGICSAGKICVDFCAALKLLPESEHQIVAVAARDKSKAEEFAQTYQIQTTYGSYQELANDESVDIVYVGTIHPYHAEVSKLFINAGKHVLCEKPMAMNARQCKEVLELAKAKSVFFMEGFWSRCFPVTRKIVSSLQNGDIGDVRILSAEFGSVSTQTKRFTERDLGGGVLLDMGCYPVMYANLVFNDEEPEKITANAVLNENGVDLTTNITIQYKDGRMARILTSVEYNLEETAVICGRKGNIKVKNFWCPQAAEINGEKIADDNFPVAKHSTYFRNSGGLSYEAQCVRDCILKGHKECPLMPHKDSLAIIEIMDEVRRQIGVTYPADDE